MLRKVRPEVWRYAALGTAIIILGCAIEFVMNLRILSLPERLKGVIEVPVEKIVFEGFEETENGMKFNHDKGIIHIDFGGEYVDKLVYSFDYEGLLNADAYVGIYNAYGEVREKDEIHITDRNNFHVNKSYLNIGKNVEYVNLVIKQEKLNEPGLDYIDFEKIPLYIKDIYIKNEPLFNICRVMFYISVMGIASLLWFGRSIIGKKVEIGFIAIAFSMGLIMVTALPVTKNSWDEEIHFERTFWLACYPRGAAVTETVLQQFRAGIDTWPFNQPQSLEEQRALNEYLNTTTDYKHGDCKWSAVTDKASVCGYIVSALFVKAARLFDIPFSVLYRIGRFGNLLLYCGVIYFAIKKTPVGKGIMAFIALMPTPVFLASVYSYDAAVTAFLMLSFAYMMNEILNTTKKITWKSYAVMTVSFIVGASIKAIYAPLILIALLLGKEKFTDKRQHVLMKGGIIAVFLLLMLSFVLPVIISPSATGDLRGGATSQIGQMSYILGHPFIYASILIKNIARTLPEYIAGKSVFGSLGHMGSIKYEWLLYAAATAVILTNSQSACGKALKGRQKLWILFLTAASAALIWTAMYISYTVPGETYIAGVQGRYYIPYLFLIYLLINSRRVIINLDNDSYYSIILLIPAVILMSTVYISILKSYCF